MESHPAIILIDHGSRRPGANDALEAAAAQVRALAPERFVAVAHMELSKPDLSAAVAACAGEGFREIVVVPWFLAHGRHSTEDIPRLAAAARAEHPGVTVRVARPLGPDPLLAELALRRAREDA